MSTLTYNGAVSAFPIGESGSQHVGELSDFESSETRAKKGEVDGSRGAHLCAPLSLAEQGRLRAVSNSNGNSNPPSLFDVPNTGIQWPAPSVRSATSEAAADALTATAAGRKSRESQLMRLLKLIGSRESGYTTDELHAATNDLGMNSILPRIVSDLRPKGYIETSETITRTTRKGRQAAVHFITPKGRALLSAVTP